MRLTKQTGHAIRILIDCAHAGGDLVKVADIAKRLDLTKQNVFKIVHILSHAGFVAAVRGPHGGVRLATSPGRIRVGDVVRAIEVTEVRVSDEPSGGGGLAAGGSVNGMMDEALQAFIAVLDQHSLADLAASSERRDAAAASRSGTDAAPKRRSGKPGLRASARRG